MGMGGSDKLAALLCGVCPVELSVGGTIELDALQLATLAGRCYPLGLSAVGS